MGPPLSVAQDKVLRSMLGLLQALVTESESNTSTSDRCLALISELPTIRSLMGEENDKANGTESEMFTYFKGVAMLLRGLLDSMEEEEKGDENAEAFLMEIGKIFSEASPNLIANTALQEIAQEETAAGVELEDFAHPADAYVKEEAQTEDLGQGYHGLPQWSVEQTNDQSTESKRTPDPSDNNMITDSDEDLLIVSESRSQSQKRLLSGEESQPESSKRLQSGRQYTAPDEMTARKINFYKACIQQKAQQKAEWNLIRRRLVKQAAAWRLRHGERNTQISINEACETMSRLLGQDGIEQVRTLQKEFRKSQSSARWTDILHPPLSGDTKGLILYLKQFARSNTAMDLFGENLVRSKLYGVWTSELGPANSKEKKKKALADRVGANLRMLADAFGIGILVFIPRHPHTPLQMIPDAVLKKVVDSIFTIGTLHLRIINVAKKAERMMVAAVERTDWTFDHAAEEVLKDLTNFYLSSGDTSH